MATDTIRRLCSDLSVHGKLIQKPAVDFKSEFTAAVGRKTKDRQKKERNRHHAVQTILLSRKHCSNSGDNVAVKGPKWG